MTWRSVVLWTVILAVLAFALPGCVGEGPTLAGTCREVCGEAPVISARWERSGPACECLAECAVRAVVPVAKVPPGPDGRARRGAAPALVAVTP